jgi:hypothetical protein
MDAVRLLDLYLEAFPDAVVCGWRDGKNGHGKRILEGYLNILSAGAKLGDGGALSCCNSFPDCSCEGRHKPRPFEFGSKCRCLVDSCTRFLCSWRLYF